MKKYLNIILAVLIVILIGTVAAFFMPKTKLPASAKVAKITESPTKQQVKTSSLNVNVSGQGHLFGVAPIPRPTERPDQSGRSKQLLNVTSGPVPIPVTTPGAAEVTKVLIPLTGDLYAKYIDAKTGQQIGAGSHKITGETTVTIYGDSIQADTIFTNDFTFAVNVTRPPDKRWAAGAMIGIDDHARVVREFYGQYDFGFIKTKRLDLSVPVRIEVDNRDGPRGMVGIEGHF